jgi:internalin A
MEIEAGTKRDKIRQPPIHGRRTGMSNLRVWICLSVAMALTLTMGLLTVGGTPGLVQAHSDPVVIFPDPNLETAIREAIDKPIGDIYQSEFEDLTEFSAEIRFIVNLTGLEHCTNMTLLYLRHNPISDISPLASLTNLTELDLGDNQISDISPLAGLTSLTSLWLFYNQISDISPTANLTSLTALYLHTNKISDISPLANLTNLTVLELHDNRISDISPLTGLTSLTELSLMDNGISDISPLASLTSLTSLWLNRNGISDISPLASLTNLTELSLMDNQISDISPLANANLTSLTSLDLGDNQISDISPLANANLTSLTYLELWGNQISDISPLAGLTSLPVLNLRGNQISDISPLVNLTSLTELSLGANQISDIKPLVDNLDLGEGDYVDLGFNPLSDTSLNTYIPQLRARGVIVVYEDDGASWCFIATAAYGTAMAEEIQVLREFRDEYLLTNPLGQALVNLYYRVSPPIAEFITEHPSLKPVVRAGLLPAVAMSAIAINTTPAEKAAIAGLLVLVSVALAVWATKRRGRGPEYT